MRADKKFFLCDLLLKKLLVWLLLFFFFLNLAFASSNKLNLFIWADYIPKSIIHQFEIETGILVSVNEFTNTETMYAKLKANPKAGYDMVLVSGNYVSRMQKEEMLHSIDKKKIPNYVYANTHLLNPPSDAHNDYSLPFQWGTTGILVNDKYWNPNTIRFWRDLWSPRFRNQVLMFDDAMEVMGVSMKTLGYSINDVNPEHIRQAYLRLKLLMPNVKVFNSDALINIYVDEDVTIGMIWNGDALLAQRENPHLKFIFPKDYLSVWGDYFAIPINAPHVDNAHAFINFMLRPDIAKQVALNHFYSTANLGALKLLPKEYRENEVAYPKSVTLKKSEVQLYDDRANLLYQEYWERIKLGDENLIVKQKKH